MSGCDHKFVDSLRCLKCGWGPPLPVEKAEALMAELKASVAHAKDLEERLAALQSRALDGEVCFAEVRVQHFPNGFGLEDGADEEEAGEPGWYYVWVDVEEDGWVGPYDSERAAELAALNDAGGIVPLERVKAQAAG